MKKFICSNCHKEYKPNLNKPIWNKYCGDKDLFEKWTHIQVMYKGKAVSEPQRIASISQDNGWVDVNSMQGSYPICEKTKKENVLRINNGYRCDEILLLNL